MEYEIDFDSEAEIAIVRTSGVASLEGFSAYLRSLVSDPRWRRGMDVLSDHTALEAGNLTAGDIEALVSADVSADFRVHSVTGRVHHDFPLQPKHSQFPVHLGRSFVGTSGKAASEVVLRSFSGKIRLKQR